MFIIIQSLKRLSLNSYNATSPLHLFTTIIGDSFKWNVLGEAR